LDETWVVASHQVSDMSAMMRLPWQWSLSSNGALNIQQLWASGGRTREPILMKFGTKQQIAITRLPMDRLGRNLGGRIQPTPKPFSWYWSLLLTAQ